MAEQRCSKTRSSKRLWMANAKTVLVPEPSSESSLRIIQSSHFKNVQTLQPCERVIILQHGDVWNVETQDGGIAARPISPESLYGRYRLRMDAGCSPSLAPFRFVFLASDPLFE